MLRAFLVVLVAVALLFGAFVALAPASLVAGRIEEATGGALSAREVEGTIWRGRGVLAGGGARVPVAWTLDAVPLLKGEARLHVTSLDAASATPRGDIVATSKRVALRNANLTLPATLLTQASPLSRIGLVADGEVEALTSEFDWTPSSIAGDVRVVWRRARLTLPPFPALDLGELTANLVANGSRLAGPVVNQGGDLDIRGDASVGADRSAAVTLTLTPRRADNVALGQVLAAFGKPDGAGWRIAWQTPPR